eukprot:11833032-Heterocapsa_arctica.AAC.1
MHPSSPHTSEVFMPMMPCRWLFILKYRNCRSSRPHECQQSHYTSICRFHVQKRIQERGRKGVVLGSTSSAVAGDRLGDVDEVSGGFIRQTDGLASLLADLDVD